MKQFYQRIALSLFLCISLVLYGKAQNTTVTFDDQGYTETNPDGTTATIGSSITISGYTFEYFNGSDTPLEMNFDSDDGYENSGALYLGQFSGSNEKLVITKGGGNFDFISFFYKEWSSGFQVEGLLNDVSQGTVNYAVNNDGATSNLSSSFDNVDKVVITSANGFWSIFDHFTFGTAVSNTVPTASNKTLSEAYQNIAKNIITNDFGYDDTDGDLMDHVRITTLPTNGKLFVDADNDDTYDAIEEVNTNDQISKADLDAGSLFYVYNGTSGDDSFTFDVNDGTDYSTSTYEILLETVTYPTVSFGVNTPNPSNDLENGGSSIINTELSHAFGANVTVYYNFSGTAKHDGSDYTTPSSLTIPAGQTSGSTTISITSDALDEYDETIVVDMTSFNNGIENGTQQFTFTITDDDPEPAISLQIDNVSLAENGGSATVEARLGKKRYGRFIN
jgi:hypothetical protein